MLDQFVGNNFWTVQCAVYIALEKMCSTLPILLFRNTVCVCLFLSLEMRTLMNNDSTLSTATSRRNGRPENLVSNTERGRDVTFSIMFTSAVGPTWLSHLVGIRGLLSSSKMAET
jgi:hypothetical protein